MLSLYCLEFQIFFSQVSLLLLSLAAKMCHSFDIKVSKMRLLLSSDKWHKKTVLQPYTTTQLTSHLMTWNKLNMSTNITTVVKHHSTIYY
jgi:hypothetical protein